MFSRLGHFTVRHRKSILVAAVLFVVISFVVAGGVADRLTSGGFQDPRSESERAAALLQRDFSTEYPNVLLLVTAKHGSVDDAATAAAGRRLTAELARQPDVRQVVSYWSLGDVPPLSSKDGRQALVLGVIGGSDDHVNDVVTKLSPRFTRDTPVVNVGVGGRAEVFRQVGDTIKNDLRRAEGIAFPITLVLLVVVFGSLVAAGLPLLVGVLAIAGSFLALYLVSAVTDVSVYSLNLATALGLGLAIDYSLFVVSRFREELRKGLEPHDAVVRTVETAGRTAAGGAFTVAVALLALWIFPMAFLRSFAYAGVAVALLAGLGAVVVLPALLAVLGRRVDSLRLFRHREPKPVGEGAWHRVATVVMRRPLPIATAVVLFLLLLGTPFLRLQIGLPDDRVLSSSVSTRHVQDQIRANFTSNETGALEVVAPDLGDPRAHENAITAYATSLSRLHGVARVDALTGSFVDGRQVPVPDEATARFAAARGTWLNVVPSVEPLSAAGEQLTHDVRDTASPLGRVLVAGQPAQLVDSKHALFESMPWAGLWIALATFVLLFLMFGSVLVPIKALVLNILSLTATFGAMVWIFQEGHLSGVLDFTATGSLAATMPILMFCVAFGLSMDYEVFLLSRIKEEHDRTHDNRTSVAVGLERTGRIVTAAAVLISVVFIAFATSGVAFMKLFGIGLALAVLMDAFVIRATLVPAFMALMGEANWWAPRPLRWVYDRFGISETEPPPAVASSDSGASQPDEQEREREPVQVS
ncbi:MAG TPA: MMPL family transporter [Acidimicrobiia bacterium]|nr:MMPL family transporter [Acidimicrobiia bacterium]